MNRPEQLDHMVKDTRSLVGDNLNFLPFGAPDLLPVLEYLLTLEAAIQRVRELHASGTDEWVNYPICTECFPDNHGHPTEWPCPTLQTLDPKENIQ